MPSLRSRVAAILPDLMGDDWASVPQLVRRARESGQFADVAPDALRRAVAHVLRIERTADGEAHRYVTLPRKAIA
jgi:hypothetical protein